MRTSPVIRFVPLCFLTPSCSFVLNSRLLGPLGRAIREFKVALIAFDDSQRTAVVLQIPYIQSRVCE